MKIKSNIGYNIRTKHCANGYDLMVHYASGLARLKHWNFKNSKSL